MKILKKLIHYEKDNNYGSTMTKKIFVYDKEGKRLSTKVYHDKKLDQTATYFYDDAKKLSQVQITYHILNKKEFIFYFYDNDGNLKESKVCFETPDNLLYRSEYTFTAGTDKSAKAKCFDSHNNIIKENTIDIPLLRIFIHLEPYLGDELDYYTKRVKYLPDIFEIHSIRNYKNKNKIKIDTFHSKSSGEEKKDKSGTIKIITDKDNNTKRLYLKSDFGFELIKKFFW